MRDV
jgi:hypothetical protein